MTAINDDLLAELISAGVAEALRNDRESHSQWRTGLVVAVDNATDTMRQVSVQMDGDPPELGVRMRSLGQVQPGQRVLVVFTQNGGVWCLGALGGLPDEPVGGVQLAGEVTSTEWMTWTDTGGHDYPATLAVPVVAGKVVLLQYFWAMATGSSTFARVNAYSSSLSTNVVPTIVAGEWMDPGIPAPGPGDPAPVGSYIERVAWASFVPGETESVTFWLNAQFGDPADESNYHGFGAVGSHDPFVIRAFT